MHDPFDVGGAPMEDVLSLQSMNQGPDSEAQLTVGCVATAVCGDTWGCGSTGWCGATSSCAATLVCDTSSKQTELNTDYQ